MTQDRYPAGHEYAATGGPSEMYPTDLQVTATEADMRREEVSVGLGGPLHFASIPGLAIVEFREVTRAPYLHERHNPLDDPDIFAERGWHVVERSPAGREEAPRERELPKGLAGARIPDDVHGEEPPLDRASGSQWLPDALPASATIAERTCSDWSHMMRGGGSMSSQRPQN